MKRILALILVIFMMIVSFASCARGITELYDSEQSDTQQVIQTAPNNDNNLGSETTDDNSDENIENNDNNENKENNEDDENNENDEVNDNICSHEGGADATCITESVCELCNQPYGGFDTGVHEGEAEWVSTDTAHKSVYSCCKKMISDEEAHTFVDGVCSVCEYECVEHESDGHSCVKCNVFVAHTYVNNKCSVCGLIKNGKSVTFGSYPQSKVTSSTLLSTLNAKAGTPATNASAWTSYQYAENNKMYYADVEEGGEKYRGVYFEQYRPTNITVEAEKMVAGESQNNNRQSYNGYTKGNVYWFKYDPISWTILEENTTAKKALVICDMIIDAQTYDVTCDNNYEESTIRTWLNETFLNTAFNELQKGVILVTEVDNSSKTAADYSGNQPFLSNNTNDKIFLLSKSDVKNTSYGYTYVKNESSNSTKTKTVTEYAKSQGVYANENNGGWWWLRTPMYNSDNPTKADLAHNIKISGTIHSSTVYLSSGGVVPVMWIYI